MSEQDTTDKPARKPRKKTARKATARKPRDAQRASAPDRAQGGHATGDATPAAISPAPAAPAQAPDGPAGGSQRALIRVPMPVRWRDLDAFNHVNNSKYLSYLEEARLQWMVGVPGQGLDDHVAPVVAAAQLNYRRPIAWPARVVVELFVERLGNTSLTVGHRIVAEDDAGTLYCDGHVVMVWIDRDSGAAAALPEAVRKACS